MLAWRRNCDWRSGVGCASCAPRPAFPRRLSPFVYACTATTWATWNVGNAVSVLRLSGGSLVRLTFHWPSSSRRSKSAEKHEVEPRALRWCFRRDVTWQPVLPITPISGCQMRTSMREQWDLLRLHQAAIEEFFAHRKQRHGTRVRADYRALVQTFVETGSLARAAKACGVTGERVRQLIFVAMRHLRKIGTLPPFDATASPPKHTGISSRTGVQRGSRFTASASAGSHTPEKRMPAARGNSSASRSAKNPERGSSRDEHHPETHGRSSLLHERSVTIGELRQQLEHVIARVEQGEVVDVTRGGRPVLRLTPITGRSSPANGSKNSRQNRAD